MIYKITRILHFASEQHSENTILREINATDFNKNYISFRTIPKFLKSENISLCRKNVVQ